MVGTAVTVSISSFHDGVQIPIAQLHGVLSGSTDEHTQGLRDLAAGGEITAAPTDAVILQLDSGQSNRMVPWFAVDGGWCDQILDLDDGSIAFVTGGTAVMVGRYVEGGACSARAK